MASYTNITYLFRKKFYLFAEIQPRFPLAVMKGKFVKNIEAPINIFIQTSKNPLDKAMWKVERADLLHLSKNFLNSYDSLTNTSIDKHHTAKDT